MVDVGIFLVHQKEKEFRNEHTRTRPDRLSRVADARTR